MICAEGWDKPKISCVIIARPTKSYSMYLQMVGETFTATSKKTGQTSVFKSKDSRDAAVKAGTHSKIKDKEDSEEEEPKGDKPNMFSKDTGYDAGDKCSFTPTKKEVAILSLNIFPTIQNIKAKQAEQKMLIQRADIQQKGFKEAREYENVGFQWTRRIIALTTSKETMGYIQHINIARAKSYNRGLKI